MPFSAGSAVFIYQLDFRLNYFGCDFFRIGDGGRAADENRPAAVKGANALEAPQHVSQMTAENTPVGMDFVDNYVF